MGQEDHFPPSCLSVRCRIGQATVRPLIRDHIITAIAQRRPSNLGFASPFAAFASPAAGGAPAEPRSVISRRRV
jgi:hypothetical protein